MAKSKHRLRRLVLERIRPITRNPRVQLGVAIILILTGLLEVFETVMLDTVGWTIGAHHGLVLFGTMQGLYALTEIIEGLEGIELQSVEREVETVEGEMAREDAEIAELERDVDAEAGDQPRGRD